MTWRTFLSALLIFLVMIGGLTWIVWDQWRFDTCVQLKSLQECA